MPEVPVYTSFPPLDSKLPRLSLFLFCFVFLCIFLFFISLFFLFLKFFLLLSFFSISLCFFFKILLCFIFLNFFFVIVFLGWFVCLFFLFPRLSRGGLRSGRRVHGPRLRRGGDGSPRGPGLRFWVLSQQIDVSLRRRRFPVRLRTTSVTSRATSSSVVGVVESFGSLRRPSVVNSRTGFRRKFHRLHNHVLSASTRSDTSRRHFTRTSPTVSAPAESVY